MIIELFCQKRTIHLKEKGDSYFCFFDQRKSLKEEKDSARNYNFFKIRSRCLKYQRKPCVNYIIAHF